MSKITDFLIGLVLPTLEAAGEAELDVVLQDEHDSNVDDYTATITAVHAGLNHLAPLMAKSKSKYLVGLIGAIDDEITTSAKKNGITFAT